MKLHASLALFTAGLALSVLLYIGVEHVGRALECSNPPCNAR